MEEMGSLSPLLVQLGALMTWAGLEMPKGVAVHQKVKQVSDSAPFTLQKFHFVNSFLNTKITCYNGN